MSIQRKELVEKCTANYFVDRVVPPDVFAHNLWFALQTKDTRSVDPAGARKFSLLFLQEGRQCQQGLDFDPNVFCSFDRRKILPDRGDAVFPANPAAARNGSVTSGGTEFQF